MAGLAEAKTLPAATPTPARNGSWTLKVADEQGREKCVHSLYDPEKEARGIVESYSWEGEGPLLVLGLGLGYHVAELSARHPRASIIVIEASNEISALATRLRGPKLGDNVVLATGLPLAEALQCIHRLRLFSAGKPLAVFPFQALVRAFPSYYSPLLAEAEKQVHEGLFDPFRYAKFRSDRVCIGLLDVGYYLLPEISRAIAGMGHSAIKIPVGKGEEGEGVAYRLMRTLSESRPDFLLTVNHLGFDDQGILTSFLRSIELPAASWYVDSPNLIIKGSNANISPFVSVFVWDRGYVQDLRKMGFENVHYLPLAADETVFKPLELSSAERKRYAAEAGFIGDSMCEPVRRWLQKVPFWCEPLVEELASAIQTGRASFSSALEQWDVPEEVKGFSQKEMLDFEGAVLWRATQLYRLDCVKSLAGFEHRIHGDEGWQNLLGPRFKVRPRLAYYTELPRFYNACRVNLNATSRQMASAVNQRVFDVPASGGFLLTDHQDELAELFETGTEVVSYQDPGEIARLVKYYLENASAARAIAFRARARVLTEHTYRHRLESMIGQMRRTFGVGIG